MKKKIAVIILLLILCILVSGCSSLLPSTRKDTKSPWNSYEEAKAAFDQIVPYKTTSEDLKKLGFDPFNTPNIALLTYMDVVQRFMPNPSITLRELDAGLQDCLSSKESCRAYDLGLKKISDKRFGNVMLDLFGFRRKTKISGWEFKAIIVLKNDLVVYKISGGKPKVDELLDEPLGPLQNIGTNAWRIIGL